MDRARKSGLQQRREKHGTEREQRSSRRLRAVNKQMPVSSHPDAEPLDRHLVTDSDLQAYEHEGRKAPAIVSINGEDVEKDALERRRVA